MPGVARSRSQMTSCANDIARRRARPHSRVTARASPGEPLPRAQWLRWSAVRTTAGAKSSGQRHGSVARRVASPKVMPPASKKSSVTPAASTRSTDAHTARYLARAHFARHPFGAHTGRWRRERGAIELAVARERNRVDTHDGRRLMYSGLAREAGRAVRSRQPGRIRDNVPRSCRSPRASSAATTTASRTAGSARSIAATSAGSTRIRGS